MENRIVRSMDGETAFGVGPYSETRVEAVNGERLADRRVIALGINDAAATAPARERLNARGGANRTAAETSTRARSPPL